MLCFNFRGGLFHHVAKKPSGWRTSTEVLNGDTADISPFRFKFCQPIQFIDNAQFPDSGWALGRFIGIAWDTGDLFTFKVWSEPDGNWWKGQEYVRNVVRPRGEDEIPTNQEVEPDLSQFRFQRKYKTKKRKRGDEYVYELRDIPDGNEETDDTMEIGNGDEVIDNVSPIDIENPLDPARIEEESMDPEGKEDGNIDRRKKTLATPKPTKQTKQQKFSHQPDLALDTEAEADFEVESTKEINDHLFRPAENEGIGGSNVEEIIGHDWKLGQVHFRVKWSGGNTLSWEHLKDMREDYPRMTAQYIVRNKVSRSKRGSYRVLQWAKKVVRDLDRSVRRINRLYDLYLDEHDEVQMIRRVQKNSKKKKKFSKAPVYKYGSCN